MRMKWNYVLAICLAYSMLAVPAFAQDAMKAAQDGTASTQDPMMKKEEGHSSMSMQGHADAMKSDAKKDKMAKDKDSAAPHGGMMKKGDAMSSGDAMKSGGQ
jgi:hypothetical protein